MSWTQISIAVLLLLNTATLFGWLDAAVRLWQTRKFLDYWRDYATEADRNRRATGERAWLAEQEASQWKKRYEDRTADYDRSTLRLERISLIARDLPEDD